MVPGGTKTKIGIWVPSGTRINTPFLIPNIGSEKETLIGCIPHKERVVGLMVNGWVMFCAIIAPV